MSQFDLEERNENSPLISPDAPDSENLITNFDQVLDHIGHYGLWQILVVAVLWLPAISSGIIVLLWSFTGFQPKVFRCEIPKCDSAVNPNFGDVDVDAYFQDSHDPNFCNKPVLNMSAPSDFDCLKDLESNIVAYELCNVTAGDQIVYAPFEFESTLVTELDLVCQDEFKVSLVGTAYIAGLLIGSILASWPADKFGRKIMLFFFLFLGGTSDMIGGLVSDYWIYFAFRLLCGVGEMGMVMVSFTLSIELIGAKYQAYVGNMNQLMFAVGQVVCGGIAYLIRDWRNLHFATAALTLPQLLLWMIVPESPRWLMTRGKWKRAEKVLKQAQKFNGKKIPEHLKLPTEDFKMSHVHGTQVSVNKLNAWDMITKRPLVSRTIIMGCNWALVTFVYYGIGMSMTVLGGNIFLNFTLSAIFEILGYIVCILISDYWGRKPLIVMNFFVSGIACTLSSFVGDEANVAKIILVLLGKMGSSGAFSTAYVYTAELFPTPIRGTALGTCSTVGRIGSLMAPQVALYLPTIAYAGLPLQIFGIAGLIGGFISLFLPETLGHPLPDTLLDARQCGIKRNSKPMWRCWSRRTLKRKTEIQKLHNDLLKQNGQIND